MDIDVLRAGNDAEIEAALVGLPKQTDIPLVVAPDQFTST
jgi:hypothetical protein